MKKSSNLSSTQSFHFSKAAISKWLIHLTSQIRNSPLKDTKMIEDILLLK